MSVANLILNKSSGRVGALRSLRDIACLLQILIEHRAYEKSKLKLIKRGDLYTSLPVFITMFLKNTKMNLSVELDMITESEDGDEKLKSFYARNIADMIAIQEYFITRVQTLTTRAISDIDIIDMVFEEIEYLKKRYEET